MFQCMECGHRFRSARAAERALDHGCPNCGGSDIDEAPAPRTIKTASGIRLATDDAGNILRAEDVGPMRELTVDHCDGNITFTWN